MSNPPEQPRGSSPRSYQHPGYYGAGWDEAAGPRSVWSPNAPPPRLGPSRREPDPRHVLAPGFSVWRLASAGTAVAGVIGLALAWACIASAGTALFGLFGMSDTGTSVAWALGGGSVWSPFALALLSPLPFYIGAFVALVFLVPVDGKRPLPVVLLRAAFAGATGTVLLALVGVVCGAYMTARYGNIGFLFIDVLFRPLALGTVLTAVLLGASAASWLWIGKPRQQAATRSGPLH